METGNGDDIFMVNHDTALQLEEEGKLCELSGLSTIPDFTVRILDQMSDEVFAEYNADDYIADDIILAALDELEAEQS